MDITIEEAIISKTAQINENKQNCLKTKAREAFKITLKVKEYILLINVNSDLLGKDGRQILRKIKNGDLDLELVKTAKLIRRMK
uniref:Transposase n=1 Tax=Heterorhabditis bacteriophora TaxID=37862 RepID=A0A1I7W6R9_HETBA